ncbi:hypothetical protein AAKU64_004098 [Undibacterium sp. GrIS 1.8]|uniref:hypothetical protein n=1 Tax=Undibacterium sp. GrIS 1.8 TaxID=3143934 RepID=UPI00339266CC
MKSTIIALLLALPVCSNLYAGQLKYELVVDDPANLLGDKRDKVLENFNAAVDDWGNWIESASILRIQINVRTNTDGTGRFSGRSYSNISHHNQGAIKVSEESAIYKLRTGKSLSATDPDIVVEIRPDMIGREYWIDPNSKTRTDTVPEGMIDLVTVFAHELGHGFGFNGWSDRSSGTWKNLNFVSLYDELIVKRSVDGLPEFIGKNTSRVYGRALPIFFVHDTYTQQTVHRDRTYFCSISESQNITHYGRFNPLADENDLSFFGLMSGAWVNKHKGEGLRIKVGRLDAAILADLGVPVDMKKLF